jgi:hypothetical protein
MSEQPQSPPRQRRSSFVDFFNPRASSSSAVSSSPPSAVPPSPGALQHRRGISVSTLGLTAGGSGGAGGAQGQSSPYTAFARQRRASVATSSASSSPEFKNSFGDEPAVVEEDDTVRPASNNQGNPFARRMSFGAQALRDVKQGNSPGSPGAGRRPSSSLFTLDENHNENASCHQRQISSGMAKTEGKSLGLSLSASNAGSSHLSTQIDHLGFADTNAFVGEGFNWSEALRDRTKRSPSFSSGNPFASTTNKPRAPSAAVVEPPKEMPKPVEAPPTRMKKPDHLGERMLRGDFMMD